MIINTDITGGDLENGSEDMDIKTIEEKEKEYAHLMMQIRTKFTEIHFGEIDFGEKFYKFQVEMQKGEQSITTEGTISSEELRKELGI